MHGRMDILIVWVEDLCSKVWQRLGFILILAIRSEIAEAIFKRRYWFLTSTFV